MSLYRRLLELVKPYWLKLGLAMICMLFISLLTASQAFLVKPALDDVFLKKDAQMLFLLPIAIILLFLLKGIFDYGQAYLMNYVGLRIVADMREKLYNHLQNLSLSFFTKTPTGILISRITNDVNLIQGSVSNVVTGLIKDAFTILGLTGVVFYRNWKLAIIAFIIFP
jgi:subfamily B ATP-binding cassette protein MsbA